MKYFIFTILMATVGSSLFAIEYFTNNYADTVFSKNKRFAIVGELIPKEQHLADVCPVFGNPNSSAKVVNVKLLKNINGKYKLVNSYKLETSMFFCLGKECTMFITNDGRYVVKEVREYVPIKGENFISINWDVFKLEDDTIVECKASDSYRYSLALSNLISMYPNEWIRFMQDYAYRFDRNIESDFFLSVDVKENIEVHVRFYSVKEKKYIEKEMTVVLDDLCFKVDCE